MTSEKFFSQSLRSFLGPIQPMLDDPEVSEVLVNGPDEVYVERGGRLRRTDARFPSEESLMAAARHLAQYLDHPLDAEHPILEGRFPDGSRVELLLPPLSPRGPALAIRRFATERLDAATLIELGSVPPGAMQCLRFLVESKANIVVSGGTGSGKTSMLNVLGGFVGRDERVVTLEDARELQLGASHVLPLVARPADVRGRGRVRVRDLLRATLRMRPDRIVVGEVRDGVALDLVQAMSSGHGGCLTTVHASHPAASLRRLETLAAMSDVAIPLAALRAQLVSAVDIVVQVDRHRDGRRGVTHISHVADELSHGEPVVTDLYRWQRGSGSKCGGALHALPALRAAFEERDGCLDAWPRALREDLSMDGKEYKG